MADLLLALAVFAVAFAVTSLICKLHIYMAKPAKPTRKKD